MNKVVKLPKELVEKVGGGEILYRWEGRKPNSEANFLFDSRVKEGFVTSFNQYISGRRLAINLVIESPTTKIIYERPPYLDFLFENEVEPIILVR